MSSNFDFMAAEWKSFYKSAAEAEQSVNTAFHGNNKTTPILKRTVLITLKHLHLFLTWFSKICSEGQPDVPEFNEQKEYEEKFYDDSDSLSKWIESQEIIFGTVNIANYWKKVESYIRQHKDHITIHKLKFNKVITSVDISELEKMIFAGDLGSKEDFIKAYGSENPSGRFIRSIVGLDRNAAKEAFSVFLDKRPLSADQLTSINQIIDFLTADGTLDAGKLMEVPFTDIHYDGVMGIFSTREVQKLKDIIYRINDKADVG